MEWISVKERLPEVGHRVIWRGFIKWMPLEKQVRYFDDELSGDTEILEDGSMGYCLRDDTDYLAVAHDTDYCDEVLTHWTIIPKL
jgi:hypothetical protein